MQQQRVCCCRVSAVNPKLPQEKYTLQWKLAASCLLVLRNWISGCKTHRVSAQSQGAGAA